MPYALLGFVITEVPANPQAMPNELKMVWDWLISRLIIHKPNARTESKAAFMPYDIIENDVAVGVCHKQLSFVFRLRAALRPVPVCLFGPSSGGSLAPQFACGGLHARTAHHLC